MSEDVLITFNEQEHSYKDNYNNNYTSVTQLISKYTPQFDKDYWSKFKARERGISQEEVLAEWEQTNKISLVKGNKEHSFLETDIGKLFTSQSKEHISKTIVNHKDLGYFFKIVNKEELYKLEIQKKYPELYNKLYLYISDGWAIYCEKRTFSLKYLIAGTIDCLLIRGREFVIFDWKTNKDTLLFVCGYYKKEWKVINGVNQKVKTDKFIKTYDYMLMPLNNLEHCKGIEYTLQLSLYAYLLEEMGMICRGLMLYHIKNEKEQPILHKIKYLKNDVFRLLEYHKNFNPNKPKGIKKSTNFEMK